MAQIARQQLGWRMRAMPYLYTAFYDAHTFGCPVARPLFFAFPGDAGAFEASSRQWLMGDGLLIAPVTQVGTALAVRRAAGAGSCLHVHLDLGLGAGMQLHAAQLPASASACVGSTYGTSMPSPSSRAAWLRTPVLSRRTAPM